MRKAEFRNHLVEYLRKNISKGYTLESLRWALINQGYSRVEITRAIEQFNKELAKKAPILKEKPRIKYEVFDENDQPVEIKKKSFFKRLFGI